MMRHLLFGGDKKPPTINPATASAFKSDVLLYVNGIRRVVASPAPGLLLATYLRETLGLTGTKVACGEGGCGACTVLLGRWDGATGKPEFLPVNACLRPLCACDGMAIVTVEGMGGTGNAGGTGPHPIQEGLAKGNGTQCGFCTGGWATNCYGLLIQQQNGEAPLTEQQVERHFDGNLCRCTGYRPILEAFKSLAVDPTKQKLRTLSSGEEQQPPQLPDEWVRVENGRCLHDHDNDDAHTHAPEPCPGQHVCVGDMEDLCREQQHQSSCVTLHHPSGKAPPVVMTKGRARPCPSSAAPAAPRARRRMLAAAAEAPPFPDELKEYRPSPLRITGAGPTGAGQTWVRVLSLGDLLGVLKEEGETNKRRVQVLVGNTGVQGVSKYYNGSFPNNSPDTYNVLVDASAVPELRQATYDEGTHTLTVGAAVSLNRLVTLLRARDDRSGGHTPPAGYPHASSVFGMVAAHLKRIAGEQVRNAASWAGGLMLFKQYPAFPSDTNLVLAAAGARLTLAYISSGLTAEYSMEEFWTLDPAFAPFIILEATIPNGMPPDPASHRAFGGAAPQPAAGEGKADDGVVVARSFRVAQRAVNAHAHASAAMVARLAPSPVSAAGSPYPMCHSIRLVFAGVSKTAFRAAGAEAAMTGRALDEATLGLTLTALEQDLATAGGGESPLFGAPGFRVRLMRALLYKCFLVALGNAIPPRLASAVALVERPASKASQTFTPDPSLSPVSQPIPKVGALAQATGEAVYTDDEPLPQHTLHGAYVFSTKALAKVTAIDATAALQMPGVVDVVTAKDIEGKNDLSMVAGDEELLVPEGKTCQCVGQALAVVLADSSETARAAARAVVVTYEDVTGTTPVLSFAEGIERKSFLPPGNVKEIACGDAEQALARAKRRKSGRVETGGQKHFYFEPQTTLAVPSENGILNLYTSTQAPSDTHTLVAKVLGLPKHRIAVQARRAGGGFGAKLTRCCQNAAAAAVCARKLGRPVRVANDRTTDFVMVGGREPLIVDYDVGFDDAGKVVALALKVYMEAGAAADNTPGDNDMAMQWIDNAYYFPNFKATQFVVKTNLPVTTSMRAPGVVQAVHAVEMVLAEVARELGLPQQAVQEANFYKDGDCAPYGQVLEDTEPLYRVWDGAKALGQVEQRRAEAAAFNAEHRWRKRGVAMTPVKYGMGWAGLKASASVRVYQEDGSVLINHHGCEVGQGIHTKVAQAAAYKLGVPMDSITIAPTATDKIPNATATGGSSTSEAAVSAMLVACDELNTRLAPVKDKLGAAASWRDVIAAAAADGVCLSAEGWWAPPATADPFQYFVFCAAASTVEMDLLTGEVLVPRVDIVYDCGQSLNPLVDIGQIEGAFVQGLGYYLTEGVRFDGEGRLLTTGTWEYKPPSALDIPLEFNVTLIPKDLSPDSVLQSKATGEPPYMLASSLYFALKDCIREAHEEAQAQAVRHEHRRRLVHNIHGHHHPADSDCAHRAPPASNCDDVAAGGGGSSSSSSEAGGPPYEEVALPVPATLDHRVVALGVDPAEFVLR